MKNNKNITYLIVFIVLLLVIISSMSYAYFRVNTSSESTIGGIIGNTECLDISYSESNVIDLDNQYPITDEYALNNLIPVTITVTNNCTNSINYVLTNTSLSENTGYIEDNKMRISVKRQKENSEEKTIVSPIYLTELENLTSGNTYTMLTNDLVNRPVIKDFTNKTSYVIDREEIEGNTTNMYKVYLWIDYWEGDTTQKGLNNNSTQNQSYKSAISLVVNGEETPKYTVTFDPNGGTLNSENASKVVYLGEEYGELPTPTRDGYTFKGWNGKNLFNPNQMIITNTTYNDVTDELIFRDKCYDRILLKDYWVPKPDTKYTLLVEVLKNTFSENVKVTTDDRFFIYGYNNYKDNNYNNYYYLYKNKIKNSTYIISFKTRSNFSNVTIGSLWFWTNNNVIGTFKTKIAIYEDAFLTKYEPFYIESVTTVVQDKNHTLKAIWEPSS